MSAKILVVDDEKPLREFVSRNLVARGFDVKTAANGLEALSVFETQPLDLIILDIMMPNMDGLEACKRIRQKSVVPIIVLTALDGEADKVNALNHGADDCLTKPFGVEELLARVQAALRRMNWMQEPMPSEILSYRELSLNPERMSVTCRGSDLSLTQTEYKILHYLMQHKGKALSHEQILKAVWGDVYGRESEYLRVYIGRLRRKIEKDLTAPEYFITEYAYGYRFGA